MTQECDHPPQPYYSPIREPLEHPLFFYPFRGGSFGAKQLATEDALDDLFDVVIDKEGSYHLTYVRKACDGQFNLMYRRTSSSTN